MPICEWPEGCDNQCEGRMPYCGKHNRLDRKMKDEEDKALNKKMELLSKKKENKGSLIPKMSEKQSDALTQYLPKANAWKFGKMCAVFPTQKATQVHHIRGRGLGYFDDWAKERGIIKLLDERFWLAVSDDGHDWINKNHALAVERGFVMSRLEKL